MLNLFGLKPAWVANALVMLSSTAEDGEIEMVTWWFTTFMAPAIKQKVHNLTGVEFLYSAMSPDQLEIPAFITEYDMSINGLRYFQPEAPT
uniref:Uncharacterized protein n=1 Tax=Timema shepardi TaxID=629360 RepID=A0A7R9AV01_TIMSH|nr:unnamed protein product [Timema shepardi]